MRIYCIFVLKCLIIILVFGFEPCNLLKSKNLANIAVTIFKANVMKKRLVCVCVCAHACT